MIGGERDDYRWCQPAQGRLELVKDVVSTGEGSTALFPSTEWVKPKKLTVEQRVFITEGIHLDGVKLKAKDFFSPEEFAIKVK